MKITETDFLDEDIKNAIITALEVGCDYYYLKGFQNFQINNYILDF